MRISDWSSDVCSSDLQVGRPSVRVAAVAGLAASFLSFLVLGDRELRRERSEYNYLLTTNNRSEEHTSELQSLMRISYAVFCLKKKTKQTDNKANKEIPKYNMKLKEKKNNNKNRKN